MALTARATYLPITSHSRLTRVPTLAPRRFVCVQVCGMICTSNASSASDGDRQADAIHRDRALGHEQRREVLGEADLHPPEVAVGPHVDDGADAIGVAEHEVPAEARVGTHRAFEVDSVAGLEVAERGHAHRFGTDVERHRQAASFNAGEADAVHRKALAHLKALGQIGAEVETHCARALLDGNDIADRLNEACEHSR